MSPIRPYLVVGLGNPLFRDDGLGWYLIQELKNKVTPQIEVIWLPNFFDILLWIEGRKKVVIVDTILEGARAGSVYRIDLLQDVKRSTSFTCSHSFSIGNLRNVVNLLYDRPPEIILLGVTVRDTGYGESLSTEIKSTMPVLIEAVLREFSPLPSPVDP